MTQHAITDNTAGFQAIGEAIAAAVAHMDMLGLAPWDIEAIGILQETAASNTYPPIQDRH